MGNACAAEIGDPLVGSPTIHIGLRVPKSMEVEMDAYWKSHEVIMNKLHTQGRGSDDMPGLINFYISKGAEFKDPMDAKSGETGNLLYMMSETYMASQGIAKHLELMGQHWEGMPKLGEYIKKYGIVCQIGSARVLTCAYDSAFPMQQIAKDSPCIHICFRVPAAKEEEWDEYWKSHEAIVRQTHVVGTVGDDSKAPRLTSFCIAKGRELKDPMDSASGETGNLVYIMAESYVSPLGVAKHMEIMGAKWAGMANLPYKIKEHSRMVDIGTTKVFTNFAEPSLIGSPTIHIGFRVPKAMEAEMDAYWKSHEAFVRTYHTLGTVGNDSDKPRLYEFYISKGAELKNPMDAKSGETGNLLYMMSETYATPEGVAKHLELGGKHWEGMPKLGEYIKKYGVVCQIGSAKVITCFQEKELPFKTAKDSPCIHICFRVPVAKEAEWDAYWKDHEAIVRKTHTFGTAGDDSKAPRVTSFYIAKGRELKDPMDSASGETGSLVYIMAETYAAPAGVPKHMEVMGANWAGMATLPDKVKEHSLMVDIGSTKVFTNFA